MTKAGINAQVCKLVAVDVLQVKTKNRVISIQTAVLSPTTTEPSLFATPAITASGLAATAKAAAATTEAANLMTKTAVDVAIRMAVCTSCPQTVNSIFVTLNLGPRNIATM